MKALLALLLLPLTVQAEVVATMPNQAGGRIILTDATGEGCIGGFYQASMFTRSGYMLDGCWTVADVGEPVVIIVWSDGDKNMYPAGNFQRTPEADEKYGL